MVCSGLVGFRVLVVAIMGAGISTLAAKTAFDSIEYLRNHELVPPIVDTTYPYSPMGH